MLQIPNLVDSNTSATITDSWPKFMHAVTHCTGDSPVNNQEILDMRPAVLKRGSTYLTLKAFGRSPKDTSGPNSCKENGTFQIFITPILWFVLFNWSSLRYSSRVSRMRERLAWNLTEKSFENLLLWDKYQGLIIWWTFGNYFLCENG